MYEVIRFLFLIVLMIIASAIGASIGVFILPDGYALYVCIAFMSIVYAYRKSIFKTYDKVFKKNKKL